MTDQTKEESGQEQKTPIPFEKMPPALRKQWEERHFNVVKLRNLLLDEDSILSLGIILWVGFGVIEGLLYQIKPVRFPFHWELGWSIGIFLVYYTVIGFIRRQADKHLTTLCAQHPDENCREKKQFNGMKPFNEENDPPVTRFAFRVRRMLHQPRRGLGQWYVVAAQFVFAAGYIFNYVFYVLWQSNLDPKFFPDRLWMLHLIITAGGVLMLLKNAGFLIEVKHLVAIFDGLAGLTGHSAKAEVTVRQNGKKPPCDKNDNAPPF